MLRSMASDGHGMYGVRDWICHLWIRENQKQELPFHTATFLSEDV